MGCTQSHYTVLLPALNSNKSHHSLHLSCSPTSAHSLPRWSSIPLSHLTPQIILLCASLQPFLPFDFIARQSLHTRAFSQSQNLGSLLVGSSTDGSIRTGLTSAAAHNRGARRRNSFALSAFLLEEGCALFSPLPRIIILPSQHLLP
jgi:hypothetical protein